MTTLQIFSNEGSNGFIEGLPSHTGMWRNHPKSRPHAPISGFGLWTAHYSGPPGLSGSKGSSPSSLQAVTAEIKSEKNFFTCLEFSSLNKVEPSMAMRAHAERSETACNHCWCCLFRPQHGQGINKQLNSLLYAVWRNESRYLWSLLWQLTATKNSATMVNVSVKLKKERLSCKHTPW